MIKMFYRVVWRTWVGEMPDLNAVGLLYNCIWSFIVDISCCHVRWLQVTASGMCQLSRLCLIIHTEWSVQFSSTLIYSYCKNLVENVGELFLILNLKTNSISLNQMLRSFFHGSLNCSLAGITPTINSPTTSC